MDWPNEALNGPAGVAGQWFVGPDSDHSDGRSDVYNEDELLGDPSNTKTMTRNSSQRKSLGHMPRDAKFFSGYSTDFLKTAIF